MSEASLNGQKTGMAPWISSLLTDLCKSYTGAANWQWKWFSLVGAKEMQSKERVDAYLMIFLSHIEWQGSFGHAMTGSWSKERHQVDSSPLGHQWCQCHIQLLAKANQAREHFCEWKWAWLHAARLFLLSVRSSLFGSRPGWGTNDRIIHVKTW